MQYIKFQMCNWKTEQTSEVTSSKYIHYKRETNELKVTLSVKSNNIPMIYNIFK
jgi:hypothetical protein